MICAQATLYNTTGLQVLDVPPHAMHDCMSDDYAMSTELTRWVGPVEDRQAFPRPNFVGPLPMGLGAPGTLSQHHRGQALGFEGDSAGIFRKDLYEDPLWMRATVVDQCGNQIGRASTAATTLRGAPRVSTSAPTSTAC